MEAGQFIESGDKFRRQETQFGCTCGVSAGDQDGGSADPDNLAVALQGVRQQGTKLGGPGFLIGRLTQETLERSVALVAFTQQFIYLGSGHAVAAGMVCRADDTPGRAWRQSTDDVGCSKGGIHKAWSPEIDNGLQRAACSRTNNLLNRTDRILAQTTLPLLRHAS